MRFAFVHAEKATHAVRCLCRVLHVTPSGYYAWAKRAPSRRQREDVQLRAQIRAIYTASRGTYGSPRVYEQLRQDGFSVGRARVARLLREMGLIAALQAVPVHHGQCSPASGGAQPARPRLRRRTPQRALEH